MTAKARAIVLGGLILLVLTAITVDRYWQARARYPRRSIQTSPARPESTQEAPRLLLPHEGTEFVVRLGGEGLPGPLDDEAGRHPSAHAAGTRSGSSGPTVQPSPSSDPSGIEPRRGLESGGRPPPPPRGTDRHGARPSSPRIITYTVQRDESLSSIAERFLGRASSWPQIAKRNGIEDPRDLRAGQILRIEIPR